MNQSRAFSFLEATANVVVGYVLAIGSQMALFPLVGIEAATRQMVQLGLAFTVVSLVRSYLLRRLFNALPRLGRWRI